MSNNLAKMVLIVLTVLIYLYMVIDSIKGKKYFRKVQFEEGKTVNKIVLALLAGGYVYFIVYLNVLRHGGSPVDETIGIIMAVCSAVAEFFWLKNRLRVTVYGISLQDMFNVVCTSIANNNNEYVDVKLDVDCKKEIKINQKAFIKIMGSNPIANQLNITFINYKHIKGFAKVLNYMSEWCNSTEKKFTTQDKIADVALATLVLLIVLGVFCCWGLLKI